MTTYNTGNPLGSQDPRDLFDNSQILDVFVGTRELEEVEDRLGQKALTIHGMNQRAQVQIDKAESAASDAIAAASATGAVKFYATKADAQADLANIPDDAVIEISKDESAAGARTRYKKSNNALEFVINLDQLRQDLAAGAGAERIGFVDSTVGAELVRVGETLQQQSVATGIETSGVATGSLQGVLDSVSRATRMRTALELQQRDVYLLMQGDSTGNEDWEFFYRTAVMLCQKYPTHTVFYRLWNSTTEQWLSRTLQSGTGPRVLRIYNGSVPGQNPIYWQGRLKDKAYDGFTFDLVIVNYGLNTATDAAEQESSIAACLYTLRKDQPSAELLLNIQPPDYTDANFLNRSQLRADAQKRAADGFGVASVDVFSLFAQLVNKSGNVDDWYGDKIHPNSAGQEHWAALQFAAVLNTVGGQRSIGVANSLIPNANFSRWYAGFPVWWTTSATLSRETVNVETGGAAVRCNGIGSSTGTLSFLAQELVRRMEHLPQIVIAARVKTSGSTYKPGTLYMSTGSVGGSDYAEIRGNNNGSLGEGAGGWRWAFLVVPRSFYYAKTGITIGVFSGEAGESVIVDRMLISSEHIVPESSGVDGFRAEYSYSDDAFTVDPKKTVFRNIGGGMARLALKRGAKLNVYTDFPPPDGAILTVTAVSDDSTRIAVANTADVAINVSAGGYIVTAA